MITVIHEDRQTTWPLDAADADGLWLGADAVQQATGWAWKPEGLCRDEVCVPLPPSARSTLVRDGRLNLAAMWARSGQPAVHDGSRRHWVLGTGAAQRSATLGTRQAPDFELPDLQGRPHRLSDQRERKVFLVSWASW